MSHLRPLLPALAILLSAAVCRAAPPPEPTALDSGFHELYNLHFDRARAEFDRWTQEHPEHPLGPASRLSTHLLEELNRLYLARNASPPGKPAPAPVSRPDPRNRAAFYEQARQTIARAEAHLAANPKHQDALLALVIAYGTQADYVNLVERRPWASLLLFKKCNRYAQALLRINPEAYDAWAAGGFIEYLAGSLPFYARWFARFDSVRGDKKKGIEQLQVAAARGRYLRPLAKLLLASLYLREKQPEQAERLLEELRAEFPANGLATTEFASLHARLIPGR
jgi:hypothetical protein